MSGSKRYAFIPLAESTACEAAFGQMEAAWQSGDADRIGAALDGLKPYFIYSNYPWYNRWNELNPQVLRALWQGWSREKFWAVENQQNLSSWQFHNALEPLAAELTASDLQKLCAKHDFPNKRQQPHLWERLVEEAGDDFSLWLIRRVETDLNNEKRLKVAQTHPSKSPFHVFRSQPYRPDVITPSGILARRHDAVAHNKTREWLRELPFASDRDSVKALLEGAFHHRYPELESDIEVALERFVTPSDLRLLILEMLDKLNSRAALTRFFADLRGSMNERAREGYLEELEGHLPPWKTEYAPLVQHEMTTVSFKGWSFLMRGFWSSIARRNGVTFPQQVGAISRWADATVRFFDVTRPGCFGGCLMGAPLLVLVGAIFQWGCTLLWGKAAHPMDELNWILTTLWAACASASATSDFYHGHEPRSSRFKMALCSFGSLLAMIAVGIISRIG